MSSKVWDEITYPFPNFNGAAVEVWEWKSNFMSLFNHERNNFSVLWLKLIYASKRGPYCVIWLGSNSPEGNWSGLIMIEHHPLSNTS